MAKASPAEVILLAVHYVSHADIKSLTNLINQYANVLHTDVLLRILLTHLPETVRPSVYVNFLQQLSTHVQSTQDGELIDLTPVSGLSSEEATRQVKRLHLQQLSSPKLPAGLQNDPLAAFLFLRSCSIESETGRLWQLLDLLIPFIQYSPTVQTWIGYTVVPFLRRNLEYYVEDVPSYSLIEFQDLPDKVAVSFLLARTGNGEDCIPFIGRDLRGLIGPWIQASCRWIPREVHDNQSTFGDASGDLHCPGWEQVLEWLVASSASSSTLAMAAIEQWDGPRDIDLGNGMEPQLSEQQINYLERSYMRAALACAYTISEPTMSVISGVYNIVNKIRTRFDDVLNLSIEEALSNLPDMSSLIIPSIDAAQATSYLRTDLLLINNPLTTPTECATSLLLALSLSAIITTTLGVPCTTKAAGDLRYLQDQRRQNSLLKKLVYTASTQALRDEDGFWTTVRRYLLWLHNWGAILTESDHPDSHGCGILGSLPRSSIEIEVLKAILSMSKYSLARSIYQDSIRKPLSVDILQRTIHQSALEAFDNASNPNPARGGLKKCDEIIQSFPQFMAKTNPLRVQVEALLQCTHALSDYRLSLGQGEPFSPVVLRVHSDPISIIKKVLEQNPGSYTRLQEFLEMASDMSRAGITKPKVSGNDQYKYISDRDTMRRITAMCITAALKEDDFETGYSYVVSRLVQSGGLNRGSDGRICKDQWSWVAAFEAGRYIRTEKTTQPTHLGTASGNPEIRHLEQRIECLATALRLAPNSQMQAILKNFRRCEEQLDSAIKEDAAKDTAWDAEAQMPGTFQGRDSQVPRTMIAVTIAKQADETPMSLFDLSRATAKAAQRNFTKLSNLPAMSTPTLSVSDVSQTETEDQGHRTRRRDQLREAATGTLVSGVGWLIGANMNRNE